MHNDPPTFSTAFSIPCLFNLAIQHVFLLCKSQARHARMPSSKSFDDASAPSLAQLISAVVKGVHNLPSESFSHATCLTSVLCFAHRIPRSSQNAASPGDFSAEADNPIGRGNYVFSGSSEVEASVAWAPRGAGSPEISEDSVLPLGGPHPHRGRCRGKEKQQNECEGSGNHVRSLPEGEPDWWVS